MKDNLLVGNTVRLRALEPEDIELLYRWENNPEVWRVSNTLAPFSKYILKEYIKNGSRDIYDVRQVRFIIQSLEADMGAVGAIDIFDFDPYHSRAEVGILITNEYQHKGYGSESLEILKKYAFDYLHIHQLYVHIGVDNGKSIHFFEDHGFIEAGTLREWIRGVNGFIDDKVLQCIAPD